MQVLWLTGAYLVVEVWAGFYTKSLALIADAGHMLTDVASICLALLAFWFSSRPATQEKTYGYYRSEILAGLVNGVCLVGISIYILCEAYQRLSYPKEVLGGPMLVVALIGLVVNLVSMRLLRQGADGSLNIKAAYLEVMSDLLATSGVIVAGVVVMCTKWYAADSLISTLIGLGILPRTWSLLSECTNILMEGAPGHVDIGKLREAMLQVKGVLDVHDIHVWTITSGLDAMSGHVTINGQSPSESVLSEITRVVQDDFGLRHTTIQVEVECQGQTDESCGS